ncbi:putative Zn(2)-C6 fungal-type domain-containing protein [Seiridium cardinale]
MVTPAAYATSEAGRRYSRGCPPYPFYPERRFNIPSSHHELRPSTMTERETDDSSQPRKRIAVACGRCRKRKIRCSGDPGNGGPCTNCKNAGHEPCLFLRVSSTETPLRDGTADFGYNVDAARTYHTRGTVSPHNPAAQYTADTMSTGDMLAYRHNAYPYSGGKSYYSGVSGWGAATYGDDSVDYGLSYSSYPHVSQDPVHMVPGYRYQSSAKGPVYVDPDASNYSYGNLVHRPAANHDLPTLSLSGMAASLPSSDRLPTINRSLSSTSTYRTDGLPGHYSSSKSSASHSSDVGYAGLNSTFEPPATYGSTTALPSSISARSSHSEAGAYQPAIGSGSDGIYGSEHSSYRPVHESDSYIYSDRIDSSRRESHSSGGATAGSVLSNGQVYVPDTQSHASAHSYSVSATAAAAAPQSGGMEGATTGTGAGGTTSQMRAAGHRRSAGNLRSA